MSIESRTRMLERKLGKPRNERMVLYLTIDNNDGDPAPERHRREAEHYINEHLELWSDKSDNSFAVICVYVDKDGWEFYNH